MTELEIQKTIKIRIEEELNKNPDSRYMIRYSSDLDMYFDADDLDLPTMTLRQVIRSNKQVIDLRRIHGVERIRGIVQGRILEFFRR